MRAIPTDDEDTFEGNTAGMNYDPVTGKHGPGASLNEGATALPAATRSFMGTDAPQPAERAPAPEPTAYADADRPTPEAAPEGAEGEVTFGRALGDALDGGLRFITRAFGLDKTHSEPRQRGAISEPSAGAQALANGVGAATPEEMAAIAQAVDPNGEMDHAMRTIAGLNAVWEYHLEQGDYEKAEAAAASLMIAAQKTAAQFASEAVSRFQANDFEGGVKLLQEAYDIVPDGKNIEVELGPDGTGVFRQKDMDGNVIGEGTFTPDRMVAAALGLADGQLYWKAIQDTAAGQRSQYASGGKNDPDAADDTEGRSPAFQQAMDELMGVTPGQDEPQAIPAKPTTTATTGAGPTGAPQAPGAAPTQPGAAVATNDQPSEAIPSTPTVTPLGSDRPAQPPRIPFVELNPELLKGMTDKESVVYKRAIDARNKEIKAENDRLEDNWRADVKEYGTNKRTEFQEKSADKRTQAQIEAEERKQKRTLEAEERKKREAYLASPEGQRATALGEADALEDRVDMIGQAGIGLDGKTRHNGRISEGTVAERNTREVEGSGVRGQIDQKRAEAGYRFNEKRKPFDTSNGPTDRKVIYEDALQRYEKEGLGDPASGGADPSTRPSRWKDPSRRRQFIYLADQLAESNDIDPDTMVRALLSMIGDPTAAPKPMRDGRLNVAGIPLVVSGTLLAQIAAERGKVMKELRDSSKAANDRRLRDEARQMNTSPQKAMRELGKFNTGADILPQGSFKNQFRTR